MHRRDFISLAGAALFSSTRTAFAQESRLKAIYDQLAADPGLVENAWLYRDLSVSRGVPSGRRSDRAISATATDLIVNFEISSPKIYERLYQKPIWPRGKSGVTIGVGYDLKFANEFALRRDWPTLSALDRATLSKVLGLGGKSAAAALSEVKSVVIPWEEAKSQFLAFLLYPAGQTEDVFPNCAMLPSDCFGVLVSLIYNRGPSVNRRSPSRVEMWNILNLMTEKAFEGIPEQIRSMKRLWTTKDSRGLVLRREAEAILFEEGLRQR